MGWCRKAGTDVLAAPDKDTFMMGGMKQALGWSGREALAGDRLPYLALLDGNVVLLRDGSVMLSLMVPGFSFETADTARWDQAVGD